MFSTLFIIGAWLTITPVSDMQITYSDTVNIWTDTTSVILVEFSEPMSMDGLLDVHNYKVYDSTNSIVKLYKVGVVVSIDDSPPSQPIIVDSVGTTVVALIVKRIQPHEQYAVQVFNVKDKAGNVIGDKNEGWFYFNGFVPNKIGTPNIEMNKD